MAEPTRTGRLSEAFVRLETSKKLILIVTLALMPLGIIALLASLQSTRSADEQRRAELRIAATEASRRLGTQFASDIVVLKQAVAALDASANIAEVCNRTAAVLRTSASGRVPFALYGATTMPVCATRSLNLPRPATSLTTSEPELRSGEDVVDIIVQSPGGSNVAVARYSAATLGAFARPTGYAVPYRMSLEIGGVPIPIASRADTDIFNRTEDISVPVGIGNAVLSMTVSSAPFGAAEALLAFLPLVMWAAAAVVGYYVVDRTLVQPLKTLRTTVGTYEPGSARRVLARTPAIEIRELEASFIDYADRLAEREAQVQDALAAQVVLTREVHHRVKNNLQVIASLINLHARDITSDEVQTAYARIQRRVDALAIVHRNHFAELEANDGIDARGLLSELVANFRTSARRGETPAVTLAAAPAQIAQDVAVPLAFMFTELAEMALHADRTAPIAVTLAHANGTIIFSIKGDAVPVPGTESTGMRIVEGLARQLRSSLVFDPIEKSWSIAIATVPGR